MYEAFQLLLNGEIIAAAFYPYTSLMFNMFYGMLLFFTMAMIYLKTQNYGTAGVVGMLVSFLGIAYFPIQIKFVSFMFFVLSITITFYKVFKG